MRLHHVIVICVYTNFSVYLVKAASILQHHHLFPCEMTSEERAQTFHTDDMSLP